MKSFERIYCDAEALTLPWEIEARQVARDLRRATGVKGTRKLVNIGEGVARSIIDVLDMSGNYRSPEMRADLHKTAIHMDRIINGEVDPKYYLCDLPTGTGKTSLITGYAHLLSVRHPDQGVLICVPNIREIDDLVQRLKFFGMNEAQIYVYTSDNKANALGCPHDKGNDASICITTQQMVKSRLFKVARFADLTEFHFKGKSRTLKLWDEALIPWEELALTVDEIAKLPSIVRRYNPSLADRLLDVSEEVRKLDNAKYEFPDLVAECGFREDDFKKDVLAWRDDSDRARLLVRTLISLCGRSVRVSKDRDLNTVLNWQNHIPDDFLPALIFDASGRVRSMYERYGACTGKLENITKATKRYDNVTFHHVNIAGSKDGWRKQAEKLFLATGHCISNEPERPCLVIHHKQEAELTFSASRRFGGKVPDIASELKGQAENPETLHFLTWGLHSQTNAFESLDKLVLPGLYRLPQRTIEVRTRGSNQLSNDDAVRAESLREIELGELKNDILQAVGRICIRRCIRGENGEAQAPQADVYVLASNRAGCSIPDLLRELFPGCKVKNHPVPGAKLRKWEMALGALDQRTAGMQEARIPHTQIMEDIGIKVRTNFTRDVRNDPGFRSGLRERNTQDDGKQFVKHSF
jgi:hypothetical protein